MLTAGKAEFTANQDGVEAETAAAVASAVAEPAKNASNGGAAAAGATLTVDSTRTLHSILPPCFLQYLSDNGADTSVYKKPLHNLPRFVRVNPRRPVSQAELEEQLGSPLTPIPWLAPATFFALDGSKKIAGTDAYRSGKLYGIDASSGAAVLALDVQPGQDVLDVCCAPGAKLTMIADALDGKGSAVGLDISQHRLAACRTVVTKYGLADMCTLILADGSTFPAPLEHADCLPVTKKQRCQQKADGAGSSIHVAAPKLPEMFDRVLVDAECTHDGSIKHLLKYEKWGWETFQERMLNPERLNTIVQLQRRLLTNGFKLLRPGGYLVYSTCSMTQAQNEEVVSWFLNDNPSAELVQPTPFVSSSKASNVGEGAASSTSHFQHSSTPEAPWISGTLQHTVRFDPVQSQTSALFIAKICKKLSIA